VCVVEERASSGFMLSRAYRFNDLDSVSRLTRKQAIHAGNADSDLIKSRSRYRCDVFVLVHGEQSLCCTLLLP
jgi:hypothetical protein